MKFDTGLAARTLSEVPATARAAEEMGFDGIWTAETGHDPYLPVALAAEHTSRISLGTSIAVAFPRSPLVHAMTAWDLQALSGGRFILGLGTQVKGHNERRFGVKWESPGPRLREMIQMIRAVWDCFQNGTRPRFEGRFYNFTLMTPFFHGGPIEHPEIPHGPIRICFTPDEEVGRGVDRRLPGDLKAEFAYTLDGAELGEIVYETFSADKAEVHIEGVSIHPGHAKDTLVNALHLAAKIVDVLPHVTRTPETTAGREGFIHIYQMTGTAASVVLHFILRDFELDGLRRHGELVQQVCATVQATEPRARITCTITPQYRNMRYWLENDMRPVDLAREACRQVAIEPTSTPTRGGTDGSRLTEMGVPTPNLFTGMQNIHGPQEWISVQDMARATELCVTLAELWSQAQPAAPNEAR